MYARSVIPPLPTNTPKQVTEALSKYARAFDVVERAMPDDLGDVALEAARQADREAIFEAVEEGLDPSTVGKRHESAFLARREVYRTALEVARQRAGETALATAQTLDAHRDELIAAAKEDTGTAAARYLELLAQLTEARQATMKATGTLAWALRIDGRQVPNQGGTFDPRVRVAFGREVEWRDVITALEGDANAAAVLLDGDAARAANLERERQAQERNAQRLAQLAADRAARAERKSGGKDAAA